MKIDWNKIKWIFKPDGTLRDIYIQEVSLSDWNNLIDLINEKYTVKYKGKKKIAKQEVIEYLMDETGEVEFKTVSIELEKIKLNCHFFLEDEIEFDIHPKQINSLEDFEFLEKFMNDVSKSLDNQVTLTYENDSKFPLMKIDVNRDIYRILTEEEAKEYWGDPNSFISKMRLFKIKTEMKLTLNRFKEKLLKSANEGHKSTKKDENVW